MDGWMMDIGWVVGTLPWEAVVSLEHSHSSLKARPNDTVPQLLSLTVSTTCLAK